MQLLLLDTVKLLFNPYKVAFLVFWFYLCMWMVQRFEFSPLIPNRIKGWSNLLMLVIAPPVILVAFVIAVLRRIEQGGISIAAAILEIFGKAVESIKHTRLIGARSKASIVLLDPSGRSLKEVYGSQSNVDKIGQTVSTTESIMADAINQLASDILINPTSPLEYEIRFRIDGVLRPYRTLEASTSAAVVNSIKAISGMDIAEKRRPQDGAFVAQLPDGTVSFRVASAGILHGEKLSIRVLNQKLAPTTLDNIGMSPRACQILRDLMRRDQGMILLCGPTGSGKSTTLYAILREIDTARRNVISIEDPVEYVLPGTSQIEINTKADITFAKTLRSVLRQDPDVICVGEIRDEETADIALKASQTGHLVIATLHANSNSSAMIRLMDLGVRPLLLASSLDMIISQRLVRKLCEYCKGPAKLTESQMNQFVQNKIDPKVVFGPVGCEKCSHTGYKGRTGVFDILEVDDKMKEQISTGLISLETLRNVDYKSAGTNLRKAAMKLALAGITSLEEVKRISVQL